MLVVACIVQREIIALIIVTLGKQTESSLFIIATARGGRWSMVMHRRRKALAGCTYEGRNVAILVGIVRLVVARHRGNAVLILRHARHRHRIERLRSLLTGFLLLRKVIHRCFQQATFAKVSADLSPRMHPAHRKTPTFIDYDYNSP